MRRHVAFAFAAVVLFVLAEELRDHGLHGLGALADALKVLACATLLVAAWRAGLRSLAVAGVLLLSVTACAPLEWTHPEATPEQATADAADCQQRAWREAQWRSFAYGPWPGPMAYRRGGRWRDPFWNWNDPFFDEPRLARFCMEARGYRLESRQP